MADILHYKFPHSNSLHVIDGTENTRFCVNSTSMCYTAGVFDIMNSQSVSWWKSDTLPLNQNLFSRTSKCSLSYTTSSSEAPTQSTLRGYSFRWKKLKTCRNIYSSLSQFVICSRTNLPESPEFEKLSNDPPKFDGDIKSEVKYSIEEWKSRRVSSRRM